MAGCVKAFVVAAAAVTLVSVGATSGWAQGDWTAPPDAKKVQNPEKGKGDADGKKAVETNCVPCHGPDGKGNGPAASALNPKPANWLADKSKKETDGEIFWKITNGRGAMPSWKSLPVKTRWQIVNYIRELQKKGK